MNTLDLIIDQLARIENKVGQFETLLHRSRNSESSPNSDLLTISEAAQLLHLSVPTCYTKSYKRELPSMKKGGRLYFSRTELLEYLRSGRRVTRKEIDQQAMDFVTMKK